MGVPPFGVVRSKAKASRPQRPKRAPTQFFKKGDILVAEVWEDHRMQYQHRLAIVGACLQIAHGLAVPPTDHAISNTIRQMGCVRLPRRGVLPMYCVGLRDEPLQKPTAKAYKLDLTTDTELTEDMLELLSTRAHGCSSCLRAVLKAQA